MLIAVLEQLEKEYGEFDITLPPGRLSPYKSRARLGAWQKLSFRRGALDLTGVFARFPSSVRNLLKRYGIVTEADIDVVLNASGFAYGDQWGLDEIRNTTKEVLRFKRRGKPYIFLPQALGSFERQEIKEQATKMLSQASLVCARDDISYAASQALTIDGNLQKFPDFTCLVGENTAQRFGSNTLCIIPNNKVVSAFNHQEAHSERGQYIKFYQAVASFFIQQGWDIKLLNHEGKEDLQLCHEIASDLERCEIIDGLDALAIKGFIGGCQAVVSSRFHGCVSALSQGIPCLATSWSHKYEMLYQEYGLSGNVIDFKAHDTKITVVLTDFLASLETQQKSTLKKADEVKKKTQLMWQQVFKVINDMRV